jgi:hypothetical protein
VTVAAWTELVDLLNTGAAAKRDPSIAPSLLITELAEIVPVEERDRLRQAVKNLAGTGRVALATVPKF